MKVLSTVLLLLASEVANAYYVGRGIGDMTGPPSEVNLMGYALPSQIAGGIHMRQFARAFIFADGNAEDSTRIAYVSCDIGMGSDLVNQYVIEKLGDQLGEGLYTYDNVAISGTHTHSGPAGYLQYTLFQTTSWGWFDQSFQAYIDGIVTAIVNAHNDLQEGSLSIAQGELEGSNINRSPTSYVLNPDADDYDADTDLNMVLLQLENNSGDPLGVLNWFAVHGTSLNNTNRLISSDNRGIAGYLLEQSINGPTETVLPGQGDFVAAFASTNLGDVSPNTNGAKCIDTGLPCDAVTSTCNGRNELCIAFGPGTNGDMFESAEIIGRKQFDHAQGLMQNVTSLGDGPISFVHRFADMSNQTVLLDDGTEATTCTPAMGYAFAAGTTDGPGAFNFHQATNETTPFWSFVSDILSTPTPEQVACQAPKPILLNLNIVRPYQWDAEVVPVQLFRINNLFMAIVPAEFTTMAGRRLRNMIASRVVSSGIISEEDADQVQVVIGGLANSYADYVTTYEEYQAQRYEAASTVFGPHTHQAYMQLFESLVDEMAGLIPKPTQPSPPNLYSKMLQAIPNEVVYDSFPSGSAFGKVLYDVNVTNGGYVAGSGQVVGVTFQGANPRADLKHGGTYLTVERYNADTDSWIVVATDADLYTKFIFTRPEDKTSHESNVRIEWTPASDTTPGTHRLKYYGDATTKMTGSSSPFEGVSSSFEVIAASA